MPDSENSLPSPATNHSDPALPQYVPGRSTPGKLTRIPDIEQALLKGLAAGRSLKSLADQYQVTDSAVLQRVINLPAYRGMQSVGLELRMDTREEQLEQADTNVDVTRADRLLGHARWLAERCAPDRFGQRTALTGGDGGPVQVQVVRFSGRTIEGEGVTVGVTSPSLQDNTK